MKKSVRRSAKVRPVSRLESERRQLLQPLCESLSQSPMVRNSYVLSRFWAWLSKIEWNPELRIPMPRFLTYRDP